MTWLDSGGQRPKIEVTAGRQYSEGVHVDAGVSEVHILVCRRNMSSYWLKEVTTFAQEFNGVFNQVLKQSLKLKFKW